MPEEFARLNPSPLTGNEPFHIDGSSVGVTLLDFWRWSSSDLVSNAKRGILAEFIVAKALGVNLTGVRNEWDAFDLTTPEGITIEVKSAAFLQSWNQRDLSAIVFRTPKTRAWDADTNLQASEPRRQAQVYVFALLAHKDKKSVDPLNIQQWRFFVVPTTVLNSRKRSQHSITLGSLEKLAGPSVAYEALREVVIQVSQNRAAG